MLLPRPPRKAMGWNASDKTAERGNPSPSPRKRAGRRLPLVLLPLLLAGTLAAVYVLSLRRESSEVKETKKPGSAGRIESVSTNRAARPRPAEPGSATRVAEAKTNDVWLGVEVDHRKADTNGTLIVETIYTKDGKSHIYYHDTRPKVFDNVSDQILSLATADAPGGLPPLPSVPNLQDEFLRSLKTAIKINDDDAPEVKAMKERVKAARQEMLELLDQGMSADEVLKGAMQQRENDAATRMEAVRLVKQLLDEGDRKGAEELCAKYNEALEAMGIMKIQLPAARGRKDSEQ